MRRKFRVAGSNNPTDVFDDLDTLRRQHAAPTTARRRERLEETFARIPHDRAHDLACRRIGAAAWVILVELDRLILKARGRNPIRLSNRWLKQANIDKDKKARALRQLENAGVIRVLPYEPGRASLILHLWFPQQS